MHTATASSLDHGAVHRVAQIPSSWLMSQMAGRAATALCAMERRKRTSAAPATLCAAASGRMVTVLSNACKACCCCHED